MKLWALDSEDNTKGHVFLVNFFDGKKHHTFFDNKKAVRWLYAQYDMEIWATNVGYDLNNLFQGLSWDFVSITYIDSRIISARIKGTKIYFRDTLNHWKMSVADMGEKLGLEKKQISFKEMSKKFYTDPLVKKKTLDYCRRDTEITYQWVNGMREKYKKMGCKLKATVGSSALEFYYDNFFQRPKYILDKDEVKRTEKLKFLKEAYTGGRVEIFHRKPVKGKIFYFDVNSLYPYAMKNFFPHLEKCYWRKKPNLKKEGVCDVDIEAPKNIILPYLGLKLDTQGLVFPAGRFRGVYTYFEIRKAREMGYRVHRFYKALEFPNRYKPFEDYIDFLYKKRLEAKNNKDDLLQEACKNLMNHLYGKFFQGNQYDQLIAYKDPKELKTGDVQLGGMALRKITMSKKINGKLTEVFPPHTNGIWSCYVTAYGKDILYNYLKTVLEKKGQLIYYDTDSIIFKNDEPIFETSNELGKVKLEGILKYAYFKLPKLYKLIPLDKKFYSIKKIQYKAKGVPKKYAEKFFENGIVRFKRPYKLREVLRRNLKKENKLIPNYWEWNDKESFKTYTKRRVLPSGKTMPIILKGQNV